LACFELAQISISVIKPLTTRGNRSFRLVGGGVQLGPVGTAAANWPIVLAPADYDNVEFGGMKMAGKTEIL
jgi:hypothetical protein